MYLRQRVALPISYHVSFHLSSLFLVTRKAPCYGLFAFSSISSFVSFCYKNKRSHPEAGRPEDAANALAGQGASAERGTRDAPRRLPSFSRVRSWGRVAPFSNNRERQRPTTEGGRAAASAAKGAKSDRSAARACAAAAKRAAQRSRRRRHSLFSRLRLGSRSMSDECLHSCTFAALKLDNC